MAKGADYGGRPDLAGQRVLPSNPPQTLADLGISKQHSSDWQKLAAVPEAQFEAALATAEHPTQVIDAVAEQITQQIVLEGDESA